MSRFEPCCRQIDLMLLGSLSGFGPRSRTSSRSGQGCCTHEGQVVIGRLFFLVLSKSGGDHQTGEKNSSTNNASNLHTRHLSFVKCISNGSSRNISKCGGQLRSVSLQDPSLGAKTFNGTGGYNQSKAASFPTRGWQPTRKPIFP